MTYIAPCPCGKTPTELIVSSDDEKPKYAYCFGNCCSDWEVEFRNDWKGIGSSKSKELARLAWNAQPRAQPEVSDRIGALQEELKRYAEWHDTVMARSSANEFFDGYGNTIRLTPIKPTTEGNTI